MGFGQVPGRQDVTGIALGSLRQAVDGLALGAQDQAVAGITDGPLDAERAGDLAGAFKALGDPVRLRLLSMIASATDGEICVCDLSEAFPLTGPTISHHLRILREAGLVHGSRRGTWVYYRAIPGELTRLAAILDADRPAPSRV
ncbi:DNA-binding transcriptional regulator, ArsR family [Actinoplanes derwentensis]|uniref:DNA-binding transcriptional regulator, ArsR family n=1 Tax=Actinoplanes derwentensis TaxID=113562 RepID=A0A1H2BYE2_9ACTN|nr:DNA-binding transcriptional regulator, ArsR family [Actinoplanes derwentensis]